MAVTPPVVLPAVGGRARRRRREQELRQLAADMVWEPPKPWAADESDLDLLLLTDEL